MKEMKTTTTTVVDIRTALAEGRLTPQEERVLRMRHGISEKADAELQLKPMPNEETQAKLAMIEKMMLDQMRGQERTQTSVVSNTVANPRKDHIIERLRRAKKSTR